MSAVLEAIKSAAVQGDIPRFVTLIFEYAVSVGASDIHIEPKSSVISVRLRTDGVLKVIVQYSPSLHSGVVSKLKIMSNLKIDEQRIPQDGRLSTRLAHGEIDLRVSTFPTANGEKVVMRIVDKSKEIPQIKELGLEGYNQRVIEAAIDKPVGILLTSGPTGSGKTTTLYACLHRLNKDDVNIVTVEDPIEIQIDGLNQSQIQPNIGYTFAGGFRSILRQDPDIIMVGEIRDQETLSVAIEASLTGHLVLSTIHTNSAAQTVTRMLDMGEKAFLIAATVNAIIAQRLVRTICMDCRVAVNPTPEQFEEIRKVLSTVSPQEMSERLPPDIVKNVKLAVGKGCEKCDGTGYRGRVGIYEILVVDEEIKQLILNQATGTAIEQAAIRKGMVSLVADGLLKALEGRTTVEEVFRVAMG